MKKSKVYFFSLCELPLILGVAPKRKEQAEDICKETPDIEFEQDWAVGLGAILVHGKRIKNYFSSFRDFFGKSRRCHIIGFRMYCEPTKFDQFRWSHFFFEKIEIFNIFLMWTTLNFGGSSKTEKKKADDICMGTPDIELEQDWSVGLGAILADVQKIKNYFSSFRDFSGKSR